MEYLYVDTGLLPQETAELVSVGDLISFAQEPLELSDDIIAGHSSANAAGSQRKGGHDPGGHADLMGAQ